MSSCICSRILNIINIIKLINGIYLLHALIIAHIVSRVDGTRHVYEPRMFTTVIGGSKANRNEFPWQLRLLYGERFQCGATVLDERTVMTAAHCIIRDEFQMRRQYKVIAGDHHRKKSNGKEQTIKVERIIKHPGFVKNTLENDIALLHLEEPLNFKRNVQPVRLSDTIFDDSQEGRGDCHSTGWGLLGNYPSGRFPKVLQKLPVKIISNPTCQKRLSRYNEFVNDSMVCTYNKEVGVCQGDSGGPLGCYDESGHFRQIGIVSWIPTPNCLNPPSVYTRVSSYLDWIEANRYLTVCKSGRIWTNPYCY